VYSIVNPGDMARIKCANRRFDGKIGTVVLVRPVEHHSFIYNIFVMVNGRVYGFEETELEVLSSARRDK